MLYEKKKKKYISYVYNIVARGTQYNRVKSRTRLFHYENTVEIHRVFPTVLPCIVGDKFYVFI